MYWDKRLPSGFSDLGPIEIAPVAQGIVLTDRADGTLYMISWHSGVVRLSIVTDFGTIGRREGLRFYDAFDGPVMSENGQFRLMIRAGRIGLEYIPFAVGVQDRDDQPPYARTKFAQKAVNMDVTNPSTVHLEILDD